MGWGAEQFAYATAGAFFLACVAVTAHPAVRLSLSARVALSSAAGFLVALALVTDPAHDLSIGAVAWVLPVAPVALLAVILRAAKERAMLVSGQPSPRAVRAGRSGDSEAAGAARLERAADPGTPASELEELAFGFAELGPTLGANPSTPASVLSWLAARGDDEVSHVIANRKSGAGPDAAH